MIDLKDKAALVTGAGRGIGRDICLALAAHGARVLVTDVLGEKAAEVAEEINGGGGRALDHGLDVTREEEVRLVFDFLVEKFGGLDIMVNNAGISPKQKFEDISLEDWDRVQAVNLRGTFLCARAAVALMKERRSGKIINIASLAGQNGGTVAGAHYAASKAGVIGLTKALAKATGPCDINVNAVAPGRIVTELYYRDIEAARNEEILRQIPLGRPGTTRDIANTVVFLASDYAAYLNGACLNVNGGLFMA
jgi:NAD(P)-dependent dehydrogenase (short-subunit alcohol dehydrogenase family)